MEYEATIRERFDVVSTSGREFLCRCTFHDDDANGRPNLYVNGDSGLYYCHACHAKGRLDEAPPSPDSLLARIRKIETEGTLRRRLLMKVPPTLDETYLRQFDFDSDYWPSRGFTEQTIERFGLGFDLIHNAGTIPFRDHHGNLKGVVRRFVGPDILPKDRYRYPKGVKIHNYLFGSWMLNSNSKVAIVEGSLDAIACWNARVPAIATLGSDLSAIQIRLLHRLGIKHVVLMMDNDKAGKNATDIMDGKLYDFMVSRGVYRPYWNAKDPGDLTPVQIRKMYHSAKVSVPMNTKKKWPY